MPTFDQSTISEKTMSGDNIEHGILKDLLYVILLRMGNGEVIKILTMGSTSVERCDRKDFVAMRMITPKITKTHQEHQTFKGMMPMKDVREPPIEEDSVNQEESQNSRNNATEEETEDSEGEPEENGLNLEENEEPREGEDLKDQAVTAVTILSYCLKKGRGGSLRFLN